MNNTPIGDNYFLPNRRFWLKPALYLGITALLLVILKDKMYSVYVGIGAFILLFFGVLDYLSTSRNVLLLNDEGIHYENISSEFSTSWENIQHINLHRHRYIELHIETKDNRYSYARIGYYKKETIIEIALLLQQKTGSAISDDIIKIAAGKLPFGFGWTF